MFKNNRHLAYIALLTNTVIWGAALPIVKPALSFVSPFQYLLLRYLIALIFIFPVFLYLVLKHHPALKTLIKIGFLESFVLVFGHSILYLGLDLTNSLDASLIGITSPIFITIGGVLFLHEKEERHELVGLILAVAGTLVVTLEPFSGNSSHLTSLSGNLLVLGYVLVWTFYNLIAKRMYPQLPKLLIVSTGLLFATPILGLLMWFTQPASISSAFSLFTHNPSVSFAGFYMAILGTLLAIPTYIYGLSAIEASEASLFGYLQPLIFIPLAVIWLKEPLRSPIIIGLALILLGVYIAEKRFQPHSSKKHRVLIK